MPGVKVYPKSADGDSTRFIRANIKKRLCKRFRRATTRDDIEYCECGYKFVDHNDLVIDTARRASDHFIDTLQTDAFGYVDFSAERETDFDRKTELKNTRYIRLHYNTDVGLISELFRKWRVVDPDVIFSIISDSFSSAPEGKQVTDGSVEDIRKMICSSIVEALASANGWIITGGLNRGVDRLIGDEVKQRLAKKEKLPAAIIGISNWGCLAKKEKFLTKPSGSKDLESGSNPTGLSLNQHHTHFLLVDDGTQNKPGGEFHLRQRLESHLSIKETDNGVKVPGNPMIYVLIGGTFNAFDVVVRALNDGIPVIIAEGTGGAADTISRAQLTDDAAYEYLPEIFEILLNRLQELLIGGKIPENNARDVIVNIKTKTKLKPVYDNVKGTVADGGIRLLRDDTRAVNRMAKELEKVLIANKILPDNATQVVRGLGNEVTNETLSNIEQFFSHLSTIRNHKLLIQFNITNLEKNTITSSLVEALKKGKWVKPSDVYILAAIWDNEKFFRQLLHDEWMEQHHDTVIMELLKKENSKSFRLMIEHVVSQYWILKSNGSQKEYTETNILPIKKLLKETSAEASKPMTEDERHRKAGKMCFIWCIYKGMLEASMLFWEQGEDCLAMALLAYAESKKHKNALRNKEGYEKMKQQMENFSKHSIDLLKKLYGRNPRNTCDLLVGEVEDLKDDITPLQIAVDANFKKFLSETPVQRLLDNIWINERIENYSEYRYAPMFLSGACPLLAPKLLNIQVPSDDSSNENEKGTTTEQNNSVGRYFWKVITFLDTPLVKFTYGFISYIGYLILFSAVMLTDFRSKMSPSEIALNIWTLILIVEEVRQIIVEKRRYKNEWHYYDIAAITLYITGFIPRMIYHGEATICPSCLYVARIVLAFSLLIFFLRTLQFLSISETLGTGIYMIYRLLAVLVRFMLILMVFISAYGVVSNVMLYPNQPLNGKLLQDVFYDAWWSLVLWFNLDDALGLNCNVANLTPTISADYCSSQTDPNVDYVACKQRRCPANNWIVSVLLAFYVLLTVIMMLNVLIAIFTTSFSKMSERQKRVSKMQQYRLIREYCSRSMVPPPLCVITYPVHIVIYLIKLCRECNKTENHSLKGNAKADDEKRQRESKQTLRSRPSTGFAKLLESRVKDWERLEAEEYYERNIKEELRVAQMESEKDQTDKIDGTLMGKYIDKQIRIQMARMQSTPEKERGVKQAENAKLS